MTILRPIASFLAAVTLSASAQTPVANIELQSLEGESIMLSDTNGRFRVVNFWATWCPPCVKEMPALANLDSALETVNGDVIAINVGEDIEQVEAFILENLEPGTMTILLDPKGQSFPVFKLSALPMTLVVSEQGELLDSVVGGREWDTPEMIEALTALALENRQ